MDPHELVVYLLPTGELADQCETYWRAVAEVGVTRAQHFPPHVTVVGFFRRDRSNLRSVLAGLDAALAAGRAPEAHDVEVVASRAWPGWVGLELRSPWVVELAERFATIAAPGGPEEDAIRVKRWLHLSLAYGASDLGPAARLAHRYVDPAASAGWELGLLERLADGGWASHRRWELLRV